MKNEVFPPALVDQMKMQQGLYLLTGQKREDLISEIEALTKVSGLTWTKFQAGSEQNENLVVAFPQTMNDLLKTLALLESGCRVLLTGTASSLTNSLRQIFSLHLGDGRKHIVCRFVDQLQFALHQISVQGLNQEKEVVREIIFMNSSLRNALAQEDFSEIEALLMRSQEGHGFVSLNQSLLQLLLRRRIEMKVAFQVSRDPSHLDQLLKSVGI